MEDKSNESIGHGRQQPSRQLFVSLRAYCTSGKGQLEEVMNQILCNIFSVTGLADSPVNHMPSKEPSACYPGR